MNRYTRTAILIHWLQALLILSLLGLGYWMGTLPKGPGFSAAVGLHKSLGLCAFALIVVRLGWRLYCPPPTLPTTLALWQHRAASLVHGVIYLLLITLPLSGYLSASFTKYPMKFFGLPLPRPWEPDEALNSLFNGAHKALAITLCIALVLHIGAAVHHGLKRDGILSRMLPGRP